MAFYPKASLPGSSDSWLAAKPAEAEGLGLDRMLVQMQPQLGMVSEAWKFARAGQWYCRW